MFAEITDDLPYSHIWSSCQDDQHRCTFVDGQDFEVNVPDEDKKLYNILAKTDRNADASGDVSRAVPPFRSQSQPQTKKLRLFGFEIDSGASDSHSAMEYGESSGRLKPAYGGGTNWGSNKVLERQKSHDSDTGKATTHCLLLQKNLPELLMLGCLRCLAPGDEDKRYFVSPPAVMECQFALRYTTTKTPEEVEQNCKSACGPIRWGYEKDCLVVIAYNSIKHEPSHAISYLGFSYFEVKVTHMDTKKDECVKCARSQVDSDFRYIGETARHFYMYATKDTFQKLQGCLDVGVCENIDEEPGIVPYDLSNFKYLLSPGKESAASSPDPPGEIRTATYYCMHQSSYHNSKKQERYPLDFPARSDFHAFKKNNRCAGCILQILAMRIDVKYRPTTTRSSLLFFSEAFNVQELAIRCWSECEWISGLSESMCELLESKEQFEPKDTKMSTMPSQSIPSPFPGPSEHIVSLHDAIKYLQAKSTEDFVWFIQFNIGGRTTKDTFKKAALCVGEVSTTYVLSVESSCILTSQFKYEHVKLMCSDIDNDSIEVSSYKHIEMGYLPQPSSYAAVVRELGFTPKRIK